MKNRKQYKMFITFVYHGVPSELKIVVNALNVNDAFRQVANAFDKTHMMLTCISLVRCKNEYD